MQRKGYEWIAISSECLQTVSAQWHSGTSTHTYTHALTDAPHLCDEFIVQIFFSRSSVCLTSGVGWSTMECMLGHCICLLSTPIPSCKWTWIAVRGCGCACWSLPSVYCCYVYKLLFSLYCDIHERVKCAVIRVSCTDSSEPFTPL